MKDNQINVLVADDEEIIRDLITDLLTDQGFKVIVAKNGREAVDLSKESFFHIAFVDVHMPIMNGVETLKAIKEINPKTTIVMMDSYPDMFVDEALSEGAITCIHKPFDIKEITGIANRIIENNKDIIP